MTEQVLASGERSVAVGRDVINSIINTGDYNRFFIGDFERLRDAYIKPSQVFQRVDLAHFAGREWLLTEVDAFLHDHDRGYFVLEAEAGLGKTTFLAWLVQKRGYVHHFIELARGLEGVSLGLRNLAAQVVLAYQLSAWEAEGVLPGAAARPDFLADLLKLAADQRQSSEKVVLVVDALDEAGAPMGQNVLGLPQTLPEGVYVIASQRPVAVALQVDTASTPRRVFRLTAGSMENQADMRRFLDDAATWPGVGTALRTSGYSAGQFVETLMGKCQGVWIYLHYVIHEIERGERSPLDLNELPDGMTQYYARYWRSWRDADEAMWYESYLPLLATLATAREAVSARKLQEWTGVTLALPRLNKLLNERWRPFLAVSNVDGEARYRFYHATLAEFFAGQVEHTRLSKAEAAMANELAETTRAAHGQLADRYLSAWGGLEEELSRLQDATERDMDCSYGLRHVAWHLASARRWEELHRLVAEGKGDNQMWAQSRFLADGNYGGYLVDVMLAWTEAHRIVQETENNNEQQAALTRCMRYALIVSSIYSIAENYDPALVGRAVETGLWTVEHGLTVTAQVPRADKRALMYSAILSTNKLTAKQLDEVAKVALAAAHGNVGVLVELVPKLSGHARDLALTEGLATVGSIEDEHQRAWSVARLAPQLTSALVEKALVVAQGIGGSYARAIALTALATRLVGYQRKAALADALASAQATVNAYSRAEALAALAPQLSGRLRKAVQVQGLEAVQSIKDEEYRADPLVRLAPHLEGRLLVEGLEAAKAIEHGLSRARVLSSLALRLKGEGELLAQGVTAARSISDSYGRALALAALAPQLKGQPRNDLLQEGLESARAIRDEELRAGALAALVPQLSGSQRDSVLEEGLAAAHMVPYKSSRARCIASFAPYLTRELLEEEVAFAQRIADAEYFADALTTLALQLTGEAQHEALVGALIATSTIESEDYRSRSIERLAPQLTGVLIAEGLTVAHAIEEKVSRVRALASLAEQLGDPKREAILAEALTAVPAIEREDFRARSVAWLAPQLTDGLLSQGLAVACTIGDETHRADALVSLAPRLTGELLVKGLAAARAIGDKKSRVHALAKLAPQLEGQERKAVLAEAMVAVRTIGKSLGQEWPRAFSLAELAPQLTGELLAEGLAAAREIGSERDRAHALAALLPQLTGELLAEGLVAAREIGDKESRVDALAKLAPQLEGEDRQAALAEGLAAARAVRDKKSRVDALAKLAPQLEGQEREAALADGLAAARAIEHNEVLRSQLLMTMALHLPDAQRDEVLMESLVELRAINRDDTVELNLVALAPHLTGELLVEGLKVARALKDDLNRAGALACLAPRSTGRLQTMTCWVIRASIDARLWSRSQYHDREDVLKILRNKMIWIPGEIYLRETAIALVAKAIVDIGRWWP